MKPPVIIVGYDPRWPVLYEEEKRQSLSVIGDRILVIEYIGSTSVPGLGGKPIIDIMVGVRRLSDAKTEFIERVVQKARAERCFGRKR